MEKIDHFMIRHQKYFTTSGDPSQSGVGSAGKDKTLPLAPIPSSFPPEPCLGRFACLRWYVGLVEVPDRDKLEEEVSLDSSEEAEQS